MKRLTIQVGPYEVNCSILGEGGRAWIVDPGQDAGLILDAIGRMELQPAAILLTHAHFDHVGAVPALQAAFPGLPVFVGEGDERVLVHPMNQMPPDYPPVGRPANLRLISAAGRAGAPDGLDVEVVQTPGHTPGGVCYYFPVDRLLLSGDTLFAGSAGRTDLPGGDMPALVASLAKLAELPGDTVVVPGHGPETTIAAERRDNPFMC